MEFENEIVFTNEKICIDTLPKFEEVEMNALHPDYKKIMRFNIIVSTLIFLSIVSFFAINIYEEIWHLLIFYLPVILLQLIQFLLLNKKFNRRKYVIREKDVIYQYGLINNTSIVIPYNKIQHVSINESWLARRYSLAKITLFTTGDSLSIPGLTRDVALSVQTLILKKIKENESMKIKEEDLQEIENKRISEDEGEEKL